MIHGEVLVNPLKITNFEEPTTKTMIFTYHIIPDKNLILERIEGSVDLESLKDNILNQLWNDSKYNPTFQTFIDLRTAEIQLSPAEITELSEFLLGDEKATSGKIIILVSEPFETALAMIFESKMVTKQEVMVFSDLDRGLNRLNISLEDFNWLDSPSAKRTQFNDRKAPS